MLFSEKISTQQRVEIIDITSRVAELVKQSAIKDGLCVVYVPHTTAAVTINENADPDVKHDLVKKLEMLIPEHERYYRHAEGNSDSHLKTTLTGPSVTIILDKGKMVL